MSGPLRGDFFFFDSHCMCILKLQTVPLMILLLSALKAVKHKQQITLSGAMATVVTLSLCASIFSSSELDDKSNI